jgi:lysophospholipase L1-like esterase
MRKLLLLSIFSIILIEAYLYFAYTGFYNFIGKKALKSPYTTPFVSLVKDHGRNITYVALGDSLTAGVGSNTTIATYVYQYAQHLMDKGNSVSLINLGRPGARTTDLINNQLAYTVSVNPDVITILIGINDIHDKQSLETFKKNYSYILTTLLEKTTAHIMVMNLPYLGSDSIIFPPYNLLLNVRTRQFNDIIVSLVPQNNPRVSFVNLYDGLYKISQHYPGYYSEDLYHPSDKGYLLWKPLVNAD